MGAEPRRKAFERLLQNVLAFPTRPAVIVFMVYPHSDEFTRSAENDMLVIAQHYRVPVLSTRCICATDQCMLKLGMLPLPVGYQAAMPNLSTTQIGTKHLCLNLSTAPSAQSTQRHRRRAGAPSTR